MNLVLYAGVVVRILGRAAMAIMAQTLTEVLSFGVCVIEKLNAINYFMKASRKHKNY